MNEKIRIFSLLAVLVSAVAVSGQQGAIGGNSPAHTSPPRSGAPGTLTTDTFYAPPQPTRFCQRISAESLL